MRLLVLADTHVRDGSARDLPASVWAMARDADAIVHAGDVTGPDFLRRLAAAAPTHVVLGNNDGALVGRLPERRELTVEGVRIAVVHDAGARAGRAERMRRWFPDADVVVFGHSHQPCDELGAGGQRLFNPGSAIERRMAPFHTVGLLDVRDGTVVGHRIVRVGDTTEP